MDLKGRGARPLEELKCELARLSGAVQPRLARNATMAMARVVARARLPGGPRRHGDAPRVDQE